MAGIIGGDLLSDSKSSVKVPCFNGRGLRAFLYRVDGLIKLKGLQDDGKIAMLVRTALLGEDVLEELMNESEEIANSWEKLKNFLESNYGIEKEDEGAVLVKELMEIKQRNGEKGREYVARLRKANGVLVKELKMSDELLLMKAKLGMLPQYSVVYRDGKIENLNELARAMSVLESKLKFDVGVEVMSGEVKAKVTCYGCGGSGHVKTVCPSVSGKDKSDHAGRGTANAKLGVKCYKCGKSGHMSKSCYSKESLCFKCGKPGHVRAVCSQ